MTRLIKNKETGAVFVWTEELAKRDDMEEVKPVVPPEPVQSLKTEAESKPEKVDEDIKQMAKSVLIKKAGRKPKE